MTFSNLAFSLIIIAKHNLRRARKKAKTLKGRQIKLVKLDNSSR